MNRHNDVAIIIRSFYGIRERQAYIFKEGRGWEVFVTDYGPYVCGYMPPNYPVPARMMDNELLLHRAYS